MTDYFVHPSSFVDDGALIGKGTRIWHFCHILPGAVIGEGCNLGQNVVVMGGTRIGNNVRIQNNVSIYEGVTLEDDVFCGPSCVFTNVINPRSHVSRKAEYKSTLVRRGATIGANATIICGHELGEYCFIGAGALVDGVFSAGSAVRQGPRESNSTSDESGSSAAVRPFGKELDIEQRIQLRYDDYLSAVQRRFPHARNRFLLFETSRGCWWGARSHCTFCGLNGSTMTYRSMTPPAALAQFRELFAYASDCDSLCLFCADNIMPKEYLTEVFPFLRTPSNVKIFYEVKADLSDEEIAVLAESGVTIVQPGIEALSTATLKLMGKGTSVFQNVRFLKSCVAHGVTPIWNLLVGFPGEPEETYRKYLAELPLLEHLPPPSGVFPVRFDRYSPYFVRAANFGLNLVPLDYYELVFPFPPESIRELAYYFADQNYGAEYAAGVARYMRPLQHAVAKWRTAWSEAAPQPTLTLQGSSPDNTIVDTRDGESITYSLSNADAMLLKELERPARLAELAARFQELDIAPSLQVLLDSGLLLREKDRFMSLVCPPFPIESRSTM